MSSQAKVSNDKVALRCLQPPLSSAPRSWETLLLSQQHVSRFSSRCRRLWLRRFPHSQAFPRRAIGFLEEQSVSSVSVLSRNPTKNRLEGVTYYAGDITSTETVRALFAEIRPTVIIHSASPTSFDEGDEHHFYNINVKGTRNLLGCAAATPSVKAFIFTSSITVMACSSFIDAKKPTPSSRPRPEQTTIRNPKLSQTLRCWQQTTPSVSAPFACGFQASMASATAN